MYDPDHQQVWGTLPSVVGFTYFAISPHKRSAEMIDSFYIDDSMAARQWNVKYDHDEVKCMIRITNKSEELHLQW